MAMAMVVVMVMAVMVLMVVTVVIMFVLTALMMVVMMTVMVVLQSHRPIEAATHGLGLPQTFQQNFEVQGRDDMRL